MAEAKKRRRRRKPGDIGKVRAVMWQGIELLERHVLRHDPERDDADELCKLMYALSQVTGTYAKLIEVGDIEERLAALEAPKRRQAPPGEAKEKRAAA